QQAGIPHRLEHRPALDVDQAVRTIPHGTVLIQNRILADHVLCPLHRREPQRAHAQPIAHPVLPTRDAKNANSAVSTIVAAHVHPNAGCMGWNCVSPMNTVDSTAMPSPRPVCCAVATSPPVSPAASSGTAAMTTETSGPIMSPCPPPTSRPAIWYHAKNGSRSASASTATPAIPRPWIRLAVSSSRRPPTIVPPQAATIRGAAHEAPTNANDSTAATSPDCPGVSPCPCWLKIEKLYAYPPIIMKSSSASAMPVRTDGSRRISSGR